MCETPVTNFLINNYLKLDLHKETINLKQALCVWHILRSKCLRKKEITISLAWQYL